MSRIRSIVPLDAEQAADATALFATQYRALRDAIPFLPDAYADPATLHPLLLDIIAAGPGVGALQNGRLVGYLAGWPVRSLRGQAAVYTPEWANAAEPQDAQRIYAALYEALAAQWARDGYFDHYVTLLANDQAGLEAWQWLGFGHDTVDAVREVEPACGAADVAIRGAAREDAPAVARLLQALQAHVAGAPIFLADEGAYSPQALGPWLNDSEYSVWLAEQDGDAVGWMGFGPASDGACTIICDAGTTSITGAFTRESARGVGVATALLNAGLGWAQVQGKARCAVDFEAMNARAARFWLRHFQPVAYTLHRHIRPH